MNKQTQIIIALVAAVVLVLGVVMMNKPKEETLGDKVDAAVEQVQEATQEAGEAVQEAAEDAAEATEEAAEEVKEAVEGEAATEQPAPAAP